MFLFFQMLVFYMNFKLFLRLLNVSLGYIGIPIPLPTPFPRLILTCWLMLLLAAKGVHFWSGGMHPAKSKST